MTDDPLLLGPVLRHVDQVSASVWVQTRDATEVEVRSDGRSWTARTFGVHGHHYALVAVDGLQTGSKQTYSVHIDGAQVWPSADAEFDRFPDSRICCIEQERDVRIAFGSCRTSVAHDAAGNRSHGVDAMRAYAIHMATDDHEKWPDLIVFLGDQVYADEMSDAMCEYLASRRDLDEPPGAEIKDYDEYAHLYSIAWSDPANRWLMSTLSSTMIFDDHDIRDDWNTSAAWREDMQKVPWWHDRIVGGLSSYWVYQHLGNLSPAERADDEIWREIEASSQGSDDDWAEYDATDLLDAFAERADEKPDTYRWSYARDVGRTRLVVVDSRAARVLDPDSRSILDRVEMDWLDEQFVGGFDHLLVGTSLPFLLSPGLHQFEAWSEAVSYGAWGQRLRGFGEKVRQSIDLEHWAAFQEGFREVAWMAVEVAEGKRGEAPGTITFLSGDVHNSYVAEVSRSSGSRIVQAVCSPIRNPLPYAIRWATGFSSKHIGVRVGNFLARRAKVDEPPFEWQTTHGPWFDNNLATLETSGRSLSMRWERGVVDGDQDNPALEVVARVDVEPFA